jgi:hypothetical protein
MKGEGNVAVVKGKSQREVSGGEGDAGWVGHVEVTASESSAKGRDTDRSSPTPGWPLTRIPVAREHVKLRGNEKISGRQGWTRKPRSPERCVV